MKKISKNEMRRQRCLKRYPGMQKIDLTKGKHVWVAKQDKNGWSLGLTHAGRTIWLRNVRLKDKHHVESLIDGRISCVFIECKPF